MQDLIVSLNGNVLKATTLVGGVFNSVVKDIPREVVDDSRILDTSQFVVYLKDAVKTLSEGNKTKSRLNFVLEPEDVFFRFITVNKNGEDLETKIMAEIQEKLEGEDLNNLYFSYVKIAPFVYQFVGIKKEYLDKYLEISNSVGVELHSVLPWVLLLPKYVGTNTSSIFVCSIGTNPVVVLSEMGGVFFVGSYSEHENPEDLNKLVQELSIYKRAKPIDKVYTFNYGHLKDVEGLSIHKIEVPNSGTEQTAGFEANILANYMLDLAPDTLTSQENLLNLLPLPVAEKKQNSLVAIGAPISALLIAAVIFGGFMFFSRHKGTTPTPASGQVLSDNNQVQEASQTTSTPVDTTAQTQNLDKKDLVVRVENGSGVTGIAAKTKDVLEKLGYKVISIDTANQNRDSTLFKFKDTKMAFKDLILGDLKDDFPSTVVEGGVDTSTEYDLLIVVGTSEKL